MNKVCVGGGGGAEKLGLQSSAAPPPPPPPARSAEIFLLSFLIGPGIALMGSLQISTGSGLGKVVHAVGL